jgi:hypothetical protein
MLAEVGVVLVIAAPVILVPAALVWYLHIKDES